ncbi:MAG: carboxypeptidase regulatory-like domain-containing protein [Lewinellaceae bacterium]|nr:carboxypeptidase regulatory-like domain-containing protein [Lewinellaceae bacterium]
MKNPIFTSTPSEPKSGQALDYLLMTQGWRRFEWKEVMEAKPVAYRQPGERTVVEGQLFRKSGKPLAQAKISLYPNGPGTTTDWEGRFSFKNVDIENSHLHYWCDGYYPMSDYGSATCCPEKIKTRQKCPKFATGQPPPNAILQGKIIGRNGRTPHRRDDKGL